MKKLTVRQFLDSLSHNQKPRVIGTQNSLEEVVQVMVKDRRQRVLYVADAAGVLVGSVSLCDLKDVVFHHYLDGRIEDAVVVTQHITSLFVSENAEDFMDADPTACREDEKLDQVIARMIEHDRTDIPVLNQEGRVTANLDILDLLELWLEKGDEGFR